MDFCFILQIGCSNHLKQEGDEPHFCPRCRNPSVFAVKETKCLQICCIDLVPLGSSHIWSCNICQWQASQNGPAPPKAGGMMGGPPQHQGYPMQPGMQMQPQQPGYGGPQQPGYGGPQQPYGGGGYHTG